MKADSIRCYCVSKLMTKRHRRIINKSLRTRLTSMLALMLALFSGSLPSTKNKIGRGEPGNEANINNWYCVLTSQLSKIRPPLFKKPLKFIAHGHTFESTGG